MSNTAGIGTPLRRYWFEFVLPARQKTTTTDDTPAAYMRNGVGVTGVDEADCIRMIREHLCHGDDPPPVRSVIADVDIAAIPQWFAEHDQIGDPSAAGVWAPPFNLWIRPAAWG